MKGDEEVRQMDEFVANFTMLCHNIAVGVVALVYIGWAYFWLTGPVL
jgi:hypothetical protein